MYYADNDQRFKAVSLDHIDGVFDEEMSIDLKS